MTESKLQETVTSILTAYLSNHIVAIERIPTLITAIGQALSSQPLPTLRPETVSPPRQQGRRKSVRALVADQFGLFDETATSAEELGGETAGDDEPAGQSDSDHEAISGNGAIELEPIETTEIRQRRVSYRTAAEALAETVTEDGVTITRLPEVKRRQRR